MIFYLLAVISLVVIYGHLRDKHVTIIDNRYPIYRNSPQSSPVADNSSCFENPFGNNCLPTSFPKTPLSVKEVRLCDGSLHAKLSHGGREYQCGQDATCIKCRENFELTQRLIESFRSCQKRRRKFLMDHFKPNQAIVVISLNYGQLYLFLNFLCSCDKIGVNPRGLVYIIATDHRTYDFLVKRNFYVEPLDWINDSGVQISSKYTGLANVGPHAMINSALAAGVEGVLVENFRVIMMDVDVVWKGLPLDLFDNTSDIICSFSPRFDAYGFCNSGVVLLNPTLRTKIFFSTFVNMAAVKETSDQIMFNAMMRFYRFRELRLRVLPMSTLYTLWSSKPKPHHPKNYLIAHTVGIHKARRFQAFSLWFFNETCPWYDERVARDAKARDLI